MVDHCCTVVLILFPPSSCCCFFWLSVLSGCLLFCCSLLLLSLSLSPFPRVLVERLKRRYDLLTMLQVFNVLKQLVYIKYTKYYGAVRMLERKNYQTLRLSMGTTNHSC